MTLPAAIVVGAAAVLYLFNPVQVQFYPRCYFHLLTGLHCPGCGSLRAIHQLLHGDLPAAVHNNAVLVLALPLLLFHAMRVGISKVHHRTAPLIDSRWLWAGLVVLILFGILRNLPYSCFRWLAP